MSFLRFVTLGLAIALLPGSAAADDFHLEVDSGGWHPVHLDASEDEMTVDDRRAMQAQLKVRRQLLEVHQALSFVAAGAIIAADVVGMFNHEALDSGAPVRSELEGTLALHRVLVATTVGTYLGAGVTAWAAPAAYRNAQAEAASKNLADSGDLHVALSVAHAIGMGTMIATGALMANVAKGEVWDNLLTVHTISGFATAGLIIVAGITIGTL